MDDAALLRYSRHILLEPIGIEGQERLSQSTVLVVGAGGLGAAALMYLASAGIGRIIIADGDKVDLTNLQRQIIHREASIGINKAVSAQSALRAINASIRVDAIDQRLDEPTLSQLACEADVVLDCTDNFATRHAINRAVVSARTMLVSGAAIRFDGQIASFDCRSGDAPCYACLFPEDGNAEEERCAIMGVFAPLVGVIGSMQAALALRLLIGIGPSRQGRLLMFDALSFQWREVRFSRDPHCPVCHSTTHPQSAKEPVHA
jgi:molybdopterin/thiamine biosynthesis adenylyltransferase